MVSSLSWWCHAWTPEWLHVFRSMFIIRCCGCSPTAVLSELISGSGFVSSFRASQFAHPAGWGPDSSDVKGAWAVLCERGHVCSNLLVVSSLSWWCHAWTPEWLHVFRSMFIIRCCGCSPTAVLSELISGRRFVSSFRASQFVLNDCWIGIFC